MSAAFLHPQAACWRRCCLVLGLLLRQVQDGGLPILAPLSHGYLLTHGQTVRERTETLALLRQQGTRDKGKKVGDLAAHLN
jgi:hypothetical protein